MNYIRIRGARENNLKDIDLDLPSGKFIVITGLSGSGKSSLAFSTLYAEGQRRYIESLSAYTRQFLSRLPKPHFDRIEGLPPSIALEQRVINRNTRSTVGTATEIYDYLKLLFARVGHTFSPISGQEVKHHSPHDIVTDILSLAEGSRFSILVQLDLNSRSLNEIMSIYQKSGYSRIDIDGEITPINALIDRLSDLQDKPLFLVIDRLAVSRSKEGLTRLNDSIEMALFEGQGTMAIRIYPSRILHYYSTRFESDGMSFEDPTPQLFSFNSPLGACKECEGTGRVIGIDPHLVVPDTSLSVYEGAVVCWRGEKMRLWKEEFSRRAAKKNFPLFTPYYKLSASQKNFLWHGDKEEQNRQKEDRVYLDAFFDMLKDNQYKIQYRVMLARYRGKTPCPVCGGSRLKKEASYVKFGGRTITELSEMPLKELQSFLQRITLPQQEETIAASLMTEILHRLDFLCDVGLGYLTLNRESGSLSGGESQRIALATSLGSSLVGSLYVLDEPSIGLHSRDTNRLIRVLKHLRDLGNTVVVVEHDEDIIHASDYIVDLGPKAGTAGGEIMFAGPACNGKRGSKSPTIRYLLGEEKIPVPTSRRKWNRSILLSGARENNLKGIDVVFPLNVLTVVTGVSGSGKSTLVKQILYPAMKRLFDEVAEIPGEYKGLTGDLQCVQGVEFISQVPLGRSTRSNPVTYLKVWDAIRSLLAQQPLARQMQFNPTTFSFNAGDGRCEECKGEGVIKVEMQFMADLSLTCETCHGKRFKPDVLDVTFAGKNAFDILEMTVDMAISFFSENGQPSISNLLRPLKDVGLGYLKLGQPSSSLSGGENQRVKLAYHLGLERTKPTLFIFDEPTTGLHALDIRYLLDSFSALLLKGHSIVVVEHNLEIIKNADYIIDLGPDGGDKGGNLLVCGTPEEVISCQESYTGKALKKKLKER